jgi:hypothetical protein
MLAVYEDPSEPMDSDRRYFHDMDGCITLAGIHNPGNRARCKAALKAAMGKGGVPFQLFLDHGGRMVQREALTRPSQPVYPNLPRDCEPDIPIENWITAALDQAEWHGRAATLLDIIGGNLEQGADWTLPPEILALSFRTLLTAVLEHVPAEDIDCLEAAALFALTAHQEWTAPAIRWLEPIWDTWFADWKASRDAYRKFAGMCRAINPDLPEWIA